MYIGTLYKSTDVRIFTLMGRFWKTARRFVRTKVTSLAKLSYKTQKLVTTKRRRTAHQKFCLRMVTKPFVIIIMK
jgi:hypothetical protein